MGKHDKHIEASSQEFLENRIKDLEKRLAFAAESNAKLIKENAKWQRWFNSHTSELEEEIARLEHEIAMRDEKIARLVMQYV